MAWFLFVGRALFVYVFLLSAWLEINEISSNVGPGALGQNITLYSKLTSMHRQFPDRNVKYDVGVAITLKIVGSYFFVFDTSFGAQILFGHQVYFPLLTYDFYNSNLDQEERDQLLIKFIHNLALSGALLFFIDMKNLNAKGTHGDSQS